MLTLDDMRMHPRFEEVRRKVIEAGSDRPDVFGGEFEGGYHIQQHPAEFAALVCLLLKRCRPIDLYGEIGTAAGGCLRLIYELVGFNNALVLDNAAHPKHRHFAENTAGFRNYVSMFIGDSHSTGAKEFLSEWTIDEAFDVVFIDGDHSYDGVKQDIELVKPYCSPATLLVFHDTLACEGVHRAFAELPNKVAEFISGEQILGIGVARVGA